MSLTAPCRSSAPAPEGDGPPPIMRRATMGMCTGIVAVMMATVAVPGLGQAQVPDSLVPDALAPAAATITAAALAHDVAVLSADSLSADSVGGRRTPSLGLERTARYVAAEFQRLGLRPGVPARRDNGGDSSWFQRYPLPGQQRFDYARSRLNFTHVTGNLPGAQLGFTTDLRFLTELGPPVVVENVLNGGTDLFSMDWIRTGSARVVLVAGRQTRVTLAAHDFRDQVALYVPPAGLDSAAAAPVLAALYAQSAGVVVVRGDTTTADSAAFAAAATAASRQPLPLVDGYLRDAEGLQRRPWAVAANAGALMPWLAGSGLSLPTLRTDTTPRVQALANAAIWLDPQADSVAAAAARAPAVTVPNVLGWLEGTDSLLKQEYVIVSAHMDAGDSADAVDDNAVGVAGLLALAKALSAPEARPKRSVLFVATSGAGPGQPCWGSNVAADYYQRLGWTALGRTWVANLTLDRLGRLVGDSVVIDGLGDLAATVPAAWVAAAHPELGLRVVDGGTAATPRGDQFAFVRHNVPSLYLHGRAHGVSGPAGAAASARAARPAAMAPLALERAARVVRLAFYLGEELATAKTPPRWSVEGRQRFLSLQAEEP